MIWPERWTKLGTYDAKWLAERWPHLPKDFDWSFFQSAPHAQRLHHLRGDEPFEIAGAHPELAVIRGSLPGLATRCYAQHTSATGGSLREVPLRLDTVVFDTDALTLNLIWRGVLELGDYAGSEIAALFVFHSALDDPPATRNEIAAALAVASQPLEVVEDSPEAELTAANDVDAVTELEPGPAPASAAAPDKPSEPPEQAPTTEQALAAELDEMAAGASEQSIAAAKQHLPKLATLLDDPPDPQPAPTPDLSGLVEKMKAANASDEQIAQLIDDLSPPEPEPEAEPPPPEPPPPAAAEQETSVREMVIARLQAGEPFDGLDLADADLADLDFTGCSMVGAILQRSKLCRCTLDEANLSEAALDECDLTDASLRNAHLPLATVNGAVLAFANLDGAQLEYADLSGVNAKGATLRGVQAKGASLADAHLDSTSFERAQLESVDLCRATLDRAVFDEAVAPELRLYDACGTHVRFVRATLTEARGDGASLPNASFEQAHANGSVWERATLADATLHSAQLNDASFVRANCAAAVFSLADICRGRFTDATLAGASFLETDLLMAQFDGADLTDADLRGANLHGTATWRATCDGIQLDQAIVTETQIGENS